jgi:hypothetical protein
VVEVRREHDLRPAQQLAQPLGRRLQRELGLAVLRPAEVRGEQQPGPALAQPLDRRQRGADARVVGDAAVRERDVEVDPQEDALALDVQIVERPHSSFWRMSTQRLE